MAPFTRDPKGQKPLGSFCWRWGRSEVEGKFLHLPSEKPHSKKPVDTQDCRPGMCWGWPAGHWGTLQSQGPLSPKHLPRPSPSNCAHLGAPKPVETRGKHACPSENHHSQSAYCVPSCPHPGHTQLPCCLAKPARPACWDKFLGRQQGLQVKQVRAGRTALAVPPRKQ